MNIDKEKLESIEAKLYAILDEIKEYKKAFEKKIDVTKFTCLQTLEGHLYQVSSVAYSPDGTKIISGSDDKTIKIWDANTGECLQTLEGHLYQVSSVAYSPDGRK
ncbi:MAG: hypothetical protein IIW76_07950, partial [Bacteroidales bacterium]|nr:hypothetical protein [Bacteroidales bacterium]